MIYFPYFDDNPPRLTPADEANGRLAQAVLSRLAGRLSDEAGCLSVTAQNGVVVLEGHVEAAATARMIGELAWSVPGVSDVCNTLDHPAEWPSRWPI
jgi:osmotically-inducible protein OsmY